MTDEPWIVATHQAWKVTAFILTMLPWTITVVWMFVSGFDAVGIGPLLSTWAVAAVGFIFFALAIRCRACRRSVSWFVLTKLPVSRWLIGLVGAITCPICGDRPS
jgi:hypothetical protein